MSGHTLEGPRPGASARQAAGNASASPDVPWAFPVLYLIAFRAPSPSHTQPLACGVTPAVGGPGSSAPPFTGEDAGPRTRGVAHPEEAGSKARSVPPALATRL